MRQKLKEKFGLTSIPKAKLFRGRVKAWGSTLEAHTEEFCKLRCYANMILNTNPGSMAIVQSDVVISPPYFKRIFICLSDCLDGFLEGCRPKIGLDGWHLKGPYGEVLLTAISMDANL